MRPQQKARGPDPAARTRADPAARITWSWKNGPLRGQAAPASCTLGPAAPLRMQRGVGVVPAAPASTSHFASPAALLAPSSSLHIAFSQNNLCAQVNPDKMDTLPARGRFQEDSLR